MNIYILPMVSQCQDIVHSPPVNLCIHQKVDIISHYNLPHFALMQHPPIHTDGEDHPVVGKPLLWRCQAFLALTALMVFLYQGQGVSCLDGSSQNTSSRFASNGLH